MKNWFINLTTKAKLTCSFGLIICLLILAVSSGLSGIHKIQTAYTAEIALVQLENNINLHRAAILTILTTGVFHDDNNAVILNTINQNNALLNQLKDFGAINNLYGYEINQWKQVYQEYIKTSTEQVLPLLLKGKKDEAKGLILIEQKRRYELLAQISDKIILQAIQFTEKQVLISTLMVLFSIFSVIIVSIFTVTILAKRIALPLSQISNISNKISTGDLTVTVEYLNQKDEIGILAKSFSIMITNLKKMMNEIADVVNVINVSTGEISTSALQLVSSASETATAISQTTGTIEEVRQTSINSTEKSRTILESAQKTVDIAQTGKFATEESVLGVNQVSEQMNLVSQSMQRLSEQSQMIENILMTVDDLAQQSNLLAVNAAIEAAKAGEQGKGFSVVAQEIKTMSEQSKQATNQVRTILNDIQGATNVAVMAIEEGIKIVKVGRQKTEEAGTSIQMLADNISQSVTTVEQVANISQQQLIGVEQAANAMVNIRDASNQNVESVKQLEIAAQNLKELSHRMKELMGQYIL